MKKRILCFGDSNTWGYISGSDHQRYDEERWTKLLSKRLGDDYEIIEEGLSGRTLISDDTRVGKEGRNGFNYLLPCLDTHDPIDLVVIMLGTNELKNTFNKTPEEIGCIFEEYFVKNIMSRVSRTNNLIPKLLIIAPPVVTENEDEEVFIGAGVKSLKLNDIYKKIAKRNKCYFLSNKFLKTGIDGVHLTKDSHNVLSSLLYDMIIDIL